MSFFSTLDCGLFVNGVMLGLAGVIDKGTMITFDVACQKVGVSRVKFSCPQKYTREEADEIINEHNNRVAKLQNHHPD